MTDAPDKTPQPREPLAAPTTYQPVPYNQIFPAWERNLKFALLGAAIVVGVAGFRYWKAQQPPPVVAAIHFSRAAPFTVWHFTTARKASRFAWSKLIISHG